MTWPLRGHLYWVTLAAEPSQKVRPALVVSVDIRNMLASDILVVPASARLRPAPTHVRLQRGEAGVPRDSILKCEQVSNVPKSWLRPGPLGGPLSRVRMLEVEKAILRSIGVAIA